MSSLIRTLGTACVLVMLQAGIVGCQSAASRQDEFASGVNRPPTPRTLLLMSRMLTENGRLDQSEYVLLKIMDEAPSYLPAYVDLAELQLKQQRFTDATETLRRAHHIAPGDPVIANNLGVLLLRSREYASASVAFRAAMAADPDEARYRANLALSLALTGEFEEAYAMYTTVVPPATAYWNLGVISEAMKDMSRASEYFARSNRMNKGGEWPEQGAGATASAPVN